MANRLITACLTLLCQLVVAGLPAHASSFEDEFENFNSEQTGTFERFNKDNENAFNEAFVEQWRAFNNALTEPAPSLPKPRLQPGQDQPRQTRNQGSATPAGPAQRTRTPTPRAGDFYGHPVLSLPLFRLPSLSGVQPNNLLAFRQQALDSNDFHELIHLLGFMQQRLKADSYTTLALARRLCADYYPDNNNQLACSWILGQTHGLDVRLGERQQHLLVLTASAQQWYEQPYFDVDGQRLYIVNDEEYQGLSGDTFIQTRRHEDATALTRVGLSRSFEPALSNMVATERYGAALQVDEDFVAWLYQLPLLTVKDYLDDPIPAYLSEQLADHFHSDTEPATTLFIRLLEELQHWPYMIDEEQFGAEKPLTLSESLYFPYTDCEDRVYAMAAISRTFLGLPIAALRYPNHLSAAIQLEQRWQEADPTYIGATLGMRQPPYQGLTPEWFYP